MVVDLEPWRPHGAALLACHRGRRDATIVVRDDYGDRDEMPVAYFFRDPSAFLPYEQCALDACRGTVLDVGAGAGAHTLELQRRGFEVTAIEVLPEIVEVLRERGVRDARLGFLTDVPETFDTVLLLMNGLGLAGTLDGLDPFFDDLRLRLRPGGQVIADSTDVRSTYADGGTERDDGRYVGDITFQLEFDGVRGGPFPQVYVDPDRLEEVADRNGWDVEQLYGGDSGGYLVRLTPRG